LKHRVDQKLFSSTAIVQADTHGHTHTGPIALPGPLKWSVRTWNSIYPEYIRAHSMAWKWL